MDLTVDIGQEGEIRIQMSAVTDCIIIDQESALRLAQILNEAVMLYNGATPAERH